MKSKTEIKRNLIILQKKLAHYNEFSKKHPDSIHTDYKMEVLLPQLLRALEKHREGTFGICDVCEEEIPSERLKITPAAIRCVKCQEKYEENGRRRL